MIQVLYDHIEEARIVLAKLPGDCKYPVEDLRKKIEKLSGNEVQVLCDEIPDLARAHYSVSDVRNMLLESFDRFVGLKEVRGGLVKDGNEAMFLVYNAIMNGGGFDNSDNGSLGKEEMVVEGEKNEGGAKEAHSDKTHKNEETEKKKTEQEQGLLLAIGRALLENASGYGIGHYSCSQGQITRLINILYGRVNVDNPSGGGGDKLQNPEELSSYLKLLQKIANQDLDILKSEAQARLLDYSDIDKLKKNFDNILMGDHYEFGLNELRGMFFKCLCQEFSHSLAKFQTHADLANE